MAGGATGTPEVEYFNIQSQLKTGYTSMELRAPLEGLTGGLLYGEQPVFCGGRNIDETSSEFGDVNKECYSLDSEMKQITVAATMKTARVWAGGVVFGKGQETLFVTGGSDQ